MLTLQIIRNNTRRQATRISATLQITIVNGYFEYEPLKQKIALKA